MRKKLLKVRKDGSVKLNAPLVGWEPGSPIEVEVDEEAGVITVELMREVHDITEREQTDAAAQDN